MTTDQLKQCARDFFEQIWNQKDETAINRFIPEGAVGNDADFGSGRESFRAQWRQWITAFPDLHFQIVDIIAEDDKVLTRWVQTGTHTGTPFMGVEPTGTVIRVEGMSFDRIEDGWVVEGFDGWDALGLRRQLGLYDGA